MIRRVCPSPTLLGTALIVVDRSANRDRLADAVDVAPVLARVKALAALDPCGAAALTRAARRNLGVYVGPASSEPSRPDK